MGLMDFIKRVGKKIGHGISVGAKCVCFHPPNNNQFGYYNWDLHYLPESWKNEPIRAKYVDFTKFDGNLGPIIDFLNS